MWGFASSAARLSIALHEVSSILTHLRIANSESKDVVMRWLENLAMIVVKVNDRFHLKIVVDQTDMAADRHIAVIGRRIRELAP